MSNYRVSIVIPTYRRPDMVVRSVKSSLNQTYSNIEVIVSDDASPPEDRQWVGEFDDRRLSFITSEKNAGIWTNWTRAIQAATGDYIVLLADDDYLSANFVEKMVEAVSRNGGIDLAFSDYELHDDKGNVVVRFKPPLPDGAVTDTTQFVDWLFASKLFFASAIYKRQLLRDVWQLTKPHNDVADWSLLIQLGLRDGITVTSSYAAVYYKVEHQGSAGNRGLEIHIQNTNALEDLWRAARGKPQLRTLKTQAAFHRVTQARAYAERKQFAQARKDILRAVILAPFRIQIWKQFIKINLLGTFNRTDNGEKSSQP